MAWTSPRTWVAGEVLTALIMNTHIRDNLIALFSKTQSDIETVIGSGTATASLTVPFAVTFPSAPSVTLTVATSPNFKTWVSGITTTDFIINVARYDGTNVTTNPVVHWIASV